MQRSSGRTPAASNLRRYSSTLSCACRRVARKPGELMGAQFVDTHPALAGVSNADRIGLPEARPDSPRSRRPGSPGYRPDSPGSVGARAGALPVIVAPSRSADTGRLPIVRSGRAHGQVTQCPNLSRGVQRIRNVRVPSVSGGDRTATLAGDENHCGIFGHARHPPAQPHGSVVRFLPAPRSDHRVHDSRPGQRAARTRRPTRRRRRRAPISGIGLLLGVSPPGGLPGSSPNASRPTPRCRPPPPAPRTTAAALGGASSAITHPAHRAPPRHRPRRRTHRHPARRWHRHCGDPQQDPDQQLAALAADATTTSACPPPCSGASSRRPGLAAHDLGALRLVLRRPRTPAGGRVRRRRRARRRPRPRPRPAPTPRPPTTGCAPPSTPPRPPPGSTPSASPPTRSSLRRPPRPGRAGLAAAHPQQSGVLTDPGRGHTEAEVLAAASSPRPAVPGRPPGSTRSPGTA